MECSEGIPIKTSKHLHHYVVAFLEAWLAAWLGLGAGLTRSRRVVDA